MKHKIVLRKFFAANMAMSILLNLSMAVSASADSGFGRVIERIDFENYSENEELANKQETAVGILRFEGMNTDNKAQIETDGVTGSKVLKLTKNIGDTSSFRAVYELNASEGDGVYKVSFDIRLSVASGAYGTLGGLQGKTDTIYAPLLFSDGGMFDINFGTYINHYKNLIGNDYAHFEYTVDFGNHTAQMEVYKDGKRVMQHKKKDIAANDIYRLVWGIDNPVKNNANTGWDYDPDNLRDAVTYIDNILIEKAEFAVKSTEPKDKSINVDDMSDIRIEFNTEPGENIADYIGIYKNGEKQDSGFAVGTEGNHAVVRIDGGMDFGAEYRVEVAKGAKAKDSGYAQMGGDYEFGFGTISIMPQISGVSDGASYNKSAAAVFSALEGTSVSAELSENGEAFAEYISGTVIDREGQYILRIKASKNGKEEVKSIGFAVVGEKAPLAKNLNVVKDGLNLTAEYEFVDHNGDSERDSVIEWYFSKKEDGDFVVISDQKTITVTEDMEGGYVKFTVVPRADKEPFDGKKEESAVFALPAKPYIDGEVTISGSVKPGQTLTAEYTYKDKNGDEENGTLIEWYRTDGKGDIKEKIDNDGKKEYVMTESDADCYIMAEVTPKNRGEFGVGQKYVSKPLMSFFRPEAKDIEITNAKQGSSAAVLYTFFDANGDKEGATKVEWFLNGKPAGEGLGIPLADSAWGTLMVRVTPVSAEFPYEGTPAEATAEIKKKSNSGGGSGGGGSKNSGGASISAPIGFTKENEEKQEEEPEIVSLNDIAGHWAQKSIEKLFETGTVKGDGGKFYPDKNITRAEFAALINRMLGLKTQYADLFIDVDGSEWYADDVCSVKNAGIMNGDGASFRPTAFITREEMCVVFANIAKYKKIAAKSADITFSDKNSISPWAKEAVGICTGLNLVNGMGDGTMMPKANATKAQAAVLIDKMITMAEETDR